MSDEQPPQRIADIIAGKTVLAVRATHAEARRQLEADAALLDSVGLSPARVNMTRLNIRLANGGRIDYLNANNVNEKIRGMSVHSIEDPGAWVRPLVKAIVARLSDARG